VKSSGYCAVLLTRCYV